VRLSVEFTVREAAPDVASLKTNPDSTDPANTGARRLSCSDGLDATTSGTTIVPVGKPMSSRWMPSNAPDVLGEKDRQEAPGASQDKITQD